MKKSIFILICTFLLSGCTNTISYDFKEDTVESIITSEFTDGEYTAYNNQKSEHDFKISTSEADNKIQYDYQEKTPAASQIDTQYKFYEPVSLDTESTNNVAMYKYSFSYDEFKNNYFFKHCFETYATYEDDNFRYYRVGGKFSCDNPETIRVKVKSDYVIINANSDESENNQHIWSVRQNSNEISFAVSKTKKSGFQFSMWNIVPIIIIVVVSIISAILVNKANKNN